LFARIDRISASTRHLLALWVSIRLRDPLVQQNHMRPVFPSLAALAWTSAPARLLGTELINA